MLSPGRQARGGRRPGPNTTRDAILDAARRRFATVGYDRATFRAIAADAGVDPALVVQFFGSKPELFTAAVALPPPPGDELAALLDADPAQLGAALAALLMRWLEDPDARLVVLARIRSAASEPAAAELVRGIVTEQIAGFAQHLGVDRPETRAALVASQFVGLVMAREVVGLAALRALSGAELAALVAPALQRYLTEPLPGPS